jgi:multimeric flavodoxin WrbA
MTIFNPLGITLASFLIFLGAFAQGAEPATGNIKTQKWIFLNASQNRDGNTSALAKAVFNGLDYKAVNLVDYRIDQIGQETKGDQYRKVIEQLSGADVIVIGTPVYWSHMTGYLKTFVDRLNDIVDEDLKSDRAPLNGADVFLIVQGSRNAKEAAPGIEFVIKHISERFFMNYKGLILNQGDADKSNKELKSKLTKK